MENSLPVKAELAKRFARAVACLLLPLLVSCRSPAPPAKVTATVPISHTNLLVFHTQSGAVAPVKTRADWERRRREILWGMTDIMGPLPSAEKRGPLDLRVEENKDCGSYARLLVSYMSEPGSRVPAYLPLHPTDMQYGNRVVVEQLSASYRAYGRDLAERGYVVLAPAYPLMANYQPDLKALGYQSGTMKAIWDNVRGLDLLEAQPFVRKGKFGVIGHSLGGHNAIFTALLDSRIGVVVCSCGFDSFQAYYGGDPANWQPDRGWCQARYMPRLADYRGHLADIPFDFYELIAALAPRPVFINAPTRDANFRCQSVDSILNAASAVYRLYHVPKTLEAAYPDCEHDFPPDVREAAYRFIDQHLR